MGGAESRMEQDGVGSLGLLWSPRPRGPFPEHAERDCPPSWEGCGCPEPRAPEQVLGQLGKAPRSPPAPRPPRRPRRTQVLPHLLQVVQIVGHGIGEVHEDVEVHGALHRLEHLQLKVPLLTRPQADPQGLWGHLAASQGGVDLGLLL